MSEQGRLATCPHCGQRHSRGRLCQAEYEGWTYWGLREKEDYAGLVAHCEAVVEWSCGPDALCELGFAHVLNGQPEKTIALLAESHRKEPWARSFQRVILEALFAQGNDETAFDWRELMPVFRLDSSVLDRCHEILSSSQGYWSENYTAVGLCEDLSRDCYCVFTEGQLLEALRRHERFVVEEATECDPVVRLASDKPRKEESGEMMTSRESWKLMLESVEMPTIPDPEKDDPELDRTRLYPMWGSQKLYGEPRSREEERRQDTECYEAEYYRRKGDRQAELVHFLAILGRRPNDLAVLYYLGRTYLEFGGAEAVIEVIGAAHRAYPRLLDFQELLLDALYVLGKDEADFEWASDLRVFRLDQSVIDLCYEYLKRKRRPRYSYELEHLFSSAGCCRFTGSKLVEALGKDPRFVVEDGGVRRRRRRDAEARCRCGAVLQQVHEGGRR